MFPVAILFHPVRKEFQTPEDYMLLCQKSTKGGVKLPASLAQGVYHAGRGMWTEADTAFGIAQDTAQNLGARRSVWVDSC